MTRTLEDLWPFDLTLSNELDISLTATAVRVLHTLICPDIEHGWHSCHLRCFMRNNPMKSLLRCTLSGDDGKRDNYEESRVPETS